MTAQVSLDPKIAIRSVDFVEVLQILDVASRKPSTYTELMDSSLTGGIVAGPAGEQRQKSSFHRSWKALQVLGLMAKEERYHKPTRFGMLVLSAFRQEGLSLGPETKHRLRQAMLESAVARQNFFDLFGTHETREPLDRPAPVTVVPIASTEGSSVQHREYEVTNTATGIAYRISHRQAQGIIWGLRKWALDLDLADELYARPQDQGVSDVGRILFLVDPEQPSEMVSARFADELERLVQDQEPVYGHTVRLSISELFYQICPALRISTATARQEMIAWLEQNGNRAFVEGASQPVVKSIRRTNRSGSRIPWEAQSTALLEMGGRYYTFLFCQKQR